MTVTVGSGPYGVAVTPNGAYAYVTNEGGDTVSVISTTTNTVAATITVGNEPYGVAITPNGAYAYVTNHGSEYGLCNKYGYEYSDGDNNRWKQSLRCGCNA